MRGALLDFFFPPKCAFCGAVMDREGDGVCPACRASLPRTGEKTQSFRFISAAAAPYYYEGKVRDGLLRYKFSGARGRGRVFGREIGEDLLERDLPAPDLITWVPLSPRRERKRGYDQARILAEGAAEALGTAPVRLLRKVRHVSPQSRIRSPEERKANISGCYEVTDPDAVKGKRILLIDDIITTGATVSECARMLRLAGAEDVSAAALACHRD